MLFWVKFIYTVGVTLSCDMVVKRGPSEGLSLIYNHSRSTSICFSYCFVQVILILYTIQTALYVPSARTRPQIFLYTRKGSVGEALHCCFGEVHLHYWSCIVVRHGGHVHRDVFCSLFTRFAASYSFSNLFFSSFDEHVIHYHGYHGDLIIRASISLGPSEGASLMHTHSSR